MLTGAEKSHFRPDIEGLRAIAILLVVAYHVELPGFHGGYVGVDVFFVVSGYLITSLLLRELDSTGGINLLVFYGRRARRLLPALALMLAVTMAVGTLLYAPVEQDRVANTSIATAAYLSNVYFARAATDYVAAPSHTNPLLHTWSLSVEEQFYFVWPALMISAAGAWRRPAHRSRLWIGGWLSVVAVSSFAMCLYLTRTTQPWAFFLSPPRAWEFAVGGLAAFAGTARASRLPMTRAAFRWDGPVGWLVGLMGLGGILTSALMYGRTTVFPGVAASLPAVGTVAVLLCGHHAPTTGIARALGTRLLLVIGGLSYSWYLWHWPFLVLSKAVDPFIPLGGRLLLAVASLAVAYASYRLIEQPIRHFHRMTPAWAIAMAVVITALGIGSALLWKFSAERWAAQPTQAKFSNMKNDFAVIYRMGCDDYFRSAEVRDCQFGPLAAEGTVVLLGDSHAGHWFPAVQRLFEEPGNWRLHVITKSSCPAIDAPHFNRELGRVYSECHEWLKASLERIRSLRPDLVIVSHADTYPFSVQDWETGMRKVLNSLANSSKSVVVLRDVPGLGFDGPECLARVQWRPAWVPQRSTCQAVPRAGDEDAVYVLQRRLASAFANVAVVDMTDEVCPDRRCLVEQGGIVAYRDGAHLSTRFSESLAGALGREIEGSLAGRSLMLSPHGNQDSLAH